DKAAEQAAAHGYTALEVRLLDGEIIPADRSSEGRNQIKQTMKRHNIGIIALGLSARFSSPDAAERRANLDQLKKYLSLANDLGVPMVRTFGGNTADGHTMDETIAWVADSLADALPAAEEQGVTILLETH